MNRNNTEVDKDKWISTGTNRDIGFKFKDFAWGNINGWQKDKNGNNIDKPEGGQDHGMDALRYACSNVLRGSLFSFD